MDFVFGMVVGGVVLGIIMGIIRLIRRSQRQHVDSKDVKSSSSFSDPTWGTERSIDTRSEPDPQDEAYQELYTKYLGASTRDEYTALQKEIETNKSRITSESYDSLTDQITSELESLEEDERTKAALDAKLAKLRALKDNADKAEVFAELHKIMVSESDDSDVIISYADLEESGDSEDLDWLNSTYDELLTGKLRGMLVDAINGTAQDYEAIVTLREELYDADWTDSDDESIGDFIGEHLSKEWNEMIVRFKRDPEWSDDLYGLDDFDEDDYRKIIKKAGDKDFLSLRLLLLLIDNDVDEVNDILLEGILTDYRTQLDAAFLAIGFKSGEEERSV